MSQCQTAASETNRRYSTTEEGNAARFLQQQRERRNRISSPPGLESSLFHFQHTQHDEGQSRIEPDEVNTCPALNDDDGSKHIVQCFVHAAAVRSFFDPCLHTHTMQLLEVILIRKWRFLRSQAPTGSYVILPDKKQSSHFGMQLMFILVINSPMSLTSNARAACQRKHDDYQRVISFWLKFIFTCRHISSFYENAKKSFDGLFFEFSC